MTPDDKLCVLDFGAVSRLPDGLPVAMGTLLRIAQSGNAEDVLEGLRAEGFVKPNIEVDADAVLSYLEPFVEPTRHESFHFNREWIRGEFTRVNDMKSPDFTIGLKINLPPSYALIHRVWLGSIAVLCQLDANVPVLLANHDNISVFHILCGAGYFLATARRPLLIPIKRQIKAGKTIISQGIIKKHYVSRISIGKRPEL